MAREFDALRSERINPDLPENIFTPLPPPSRPQFRQPVDPIKIEFRGRLRPGMPVQPGYEERFLDPTKVISEASPPVPPTLNAPMPVTESGKNPVEQPYPAAVRPHVNTIEGVQRRGIVDPLTTLGAYVPSEFLSQALSTPAMAAPIAQWGRALERVKRSGVTPQTLSTFSVATRNLNNTLGVQVDPYAVLRGNPNG